MKNDKFRATNRCARCGAFTQRDAGSICHRCGKLTDKYAGGYVVQARPKPSWWVAIVLLLPLLFWLMLAAFCFSTWLQL